MTQTWGRDASLRCFERCDFPEAELRGGLKMKCDSEGYVGPADAVNHSEKCELISPQKDVLEMVFCVAACLPG